MEFVSSHSLSPWLRKVPRGSVVHHARAPNTGKEQTFSFIPELMGRWHLGVRGRLGLSGAGVAASEFSCAGSAPQNINGIASNNRI